MACQPVCPPHARRSTWECDSCTFSSPETHAVTRHLPETTLTGETLSEFTAVICYIATLYMVACPLATCCVAVVCAAHWRVFAAIRLFVCVISPSTAGQPDLTPDARDADGTDRSGKSFTSFGSARNAVEIPFAHKISQNLKCARAVRGRGGSSAG